MTPAIVQLLSTITPEGVSLGWSAIGERQIGLYAEERPAVARAAPVRRREFAAGRRAARRALVAAGAAKAAIPANPDRLPEWPNGIVGSISHTNRLAAAAVARADRFKALGLDVETIARVSLDLERMILTAPEKHWLDAFATRQVGLALVFSAKEAWYKCQYAATRTFFEFCDVEACFDANARRFEVRPASPHAKGVAPTLVGDFVIDDECVACLATSARS